MFIEQDERIIIMDIGGAKGFKNGIEVPELVVRPNLLPVDDLKHLRDIGIKTVYAQGMLDWNVIQPDLGAELNFDKLDEYIERMQQSGMKAIVPFIEVAPTWKTDDWYIRRDYYGIPNYRSEEAAMDYDAIAQALLPRYDKKYFQLTYGIPSGGEFAVHFHAYNSRLTLPGDEILPTKVLVDWVIGRNSLLEPQHNEIWTAYHHLTHPVWMDELYNAMRVEFPSSEFYGIQFTYFGPVNRRRNMIPDLQHARDTWGIKYFVGSEYCQGLREHTPIAIEHGVWGFITSPFHFEQRQKYTNMEDWMFDELAWSLKQLQDR